MSKDAEKQVEMGEAEGDLSPETATPTDDSNQLEEQKASDEAENDTQIGDDVEPEAETSLEEEFAKLKAEYQEQYDQMLRKIAEYDNAKKRAERRAEESSKYAVEGVIRDIIPIIDSVERAIASTDESKDFAALGEGIQLIHKQLLDSLRRRSVNPIEAIGEDFDPTRHEAIMHVESEDVPENAVIEEYQRGYTLHDRVIRPSMVSVSKGNPEKAVESAAQDEEANTPDDVNDHATSE
ncbi:MAG: nucleotide exchange factor GrpE [Candidatus Poribacteria bacterium]|nr:nucleotide exchange factor GrpE [Candidatus Poribacteria bacterium]MDE0503001.1 nucleotide exchange factor GrpE [Candidatus Poribacteria bacterium]